MKYSKEEKLLIGRRIYDDEINKEQAAEEYSISFGTARNYMWLYRDENNLPHKKPYQKNRRHNNDGKDNIAFLDQFFLHQAACSL